MLKWVKTAVLHTNTSVAKYICIYYFFPHKDWGLAHLFSERLFIRSETEGSRTDACWSDLQPRLNLNIPCVHRLKPDTVSCCALFLASKYEVSVSSSGWGMKGILWWWRFSQSTPSKNAWSFSSAHTHKKTCQSDVSNSFWHLLVRLKS